MIAGRVWRFSIGLTVASVVASVAAAGCSSSALTGGEVTVSSYPPVPTLSAPPPGVLAPPPGWPKDVPVADGRYRLLTSPRLTGHMRALEVSGGGEDAADQAKRRLAGAGYAAENLLGQQVYINPRHMVTVIQTDIGFGPVLVYTVSDAAALGGLTGLPDIDIGDLLGGTQ